MKSEDITNYRGFSSDVVWLREIALQLAIMNEREAKKGFSATAYPIESMQISPYSVPFTTGFNSDLP